MSEFESNADFEHGGDPEGDRVSRAAGNVDDASGRLAARVAPVLVLAVRALRIPTAIVLLLPFPAIVAFTLLVADGDGVAQLVGFFIAALMLLVSGAFWGRRRRILQAVEDPQRLASELAIMIAMSDKVDDTRNVFGQIAGGGGWKVFPRLQGMWRAAGMTGHWIDNVGDLRRARYFAPPKIGTTVAVTLAALWLIPVSVVATLFAAIAALSGVL